MPFSPTGPAAADSAAARYRRALRQGANPCRADGDSAAQVENYCRAQQRNELRAARLRRLLESHAVPPAFRLACRNYCLHLDKLCRSYSGQTLTTQAALALDRWAALGLDPALLCHIARELFGLKLD